ncbi:glycerophosphodiester phosphodiesterase family protein [Candidatus Viadribacter manganicus]|uniref:GP-PDE domain-containing protein n=1 Tax=Candidatus Viadribacter manganicus TaxID=1759059 RepID=A0A1B1AIB7_9PROT|nr:glycerophosphodiester phosphodiesterase family protein [Candidatus Viadribacter manganicus]ANP46298.1 hypothetical protein ATE48_10410 [Candidatus Viadribacter manganicus]
MKRALIAATLVLAACGEQIGGDGASIGQAPSSAGVAVPSNLNAYFDCLRDRGVTAVSVHRGGPAPGFAENAIPTFENTLSVAPSAFLEVDISRTADGVLVLMHDDRAERTTTGTGAIADLDLAQLLTFQLEDESGQRVDARAPTLAEALEWADGKTILELDIKRSVRFEDVVSEVEAANAMGRVVFVTYSVDAAARLARLAPQAMIYTTISNARELDTLERRNVDLSHIVAWTGTDTPAASLVSALAARGVETRFGMFGHDRNYVEAARAHAQIVAVENAAEAVRDLDEADGDEGNGVFQCAMEN